MRRYPAYEAALARVEALKNQGTWPGIIHLPDGGYQLAYDPGEAAS